MSEAAAAATAFVDGENFCFTKYDRALDEVLQLISFATDAQP
jgi:hypothetical protein